MAEETFDAPWARWVKWVSALSVVLLGGISLLEATFIPRHLLGGWPWLVAVVLPAMVPLGAALFIIRGYQLEPRRLLVRRLLWSTEVPLDELRRAWAAPDAMASSWRLFGNGGLFSVTGLFRNRRLGNYRAFATDPARAVVLEIGERRVVVTPGSPPRFLAALARSAPGVEIG